MSTPIKHKPSWLKTRIGGCGQYSMTKDIAGRLNTICVAGKCPNRAECWSQGTATFLIGGQICTRSCKFCNTPTGRPLPLDPAEPELVAQSIRRMNLKHAVVTSVDRDDLQDGGAEHWALTIRAIRHTCASTTLEVLIPDFRGDLALIDKLIDEGPHIVGHNLETVRRLTPAVRSLAGYDRSLKVIAHAARRVPCKTGIMVGLGETEAEVLEVMDDALRAGARMLTIGQYLPPSQKMLPVSEYVSPEKFRAWKEIALGKGYRSVESAPLVRSSYHAKAIEVDE